MLGQDEHKLFEYTIPISMKETVYLHFSFEVEDCWIVKLELISFVVFQVGTIFLYDVWQSLLPTWQQLRCVFSRVFLL